MAAYEEKIAGHYAIGRRHGFERHRREAGKSIQQFGKERGLIEQTFYLWRKRLHKPEPMRFALVETGTAQPAAPKAGLELVLV